MKLTKADTEGFNPVVTDGVPCEVKRGIHLDTMTPSEKESFDQAQDIVSTCREGERKWIMDPGYARATEVEWKMYRKRGLERMVRETQIEKNSGISSLRTGCIGNHEPNF